MGARECQKPSLLFVGPWWQEGVEVFFARACKIRYLVCLENPFMSRSFMTVCVIVFPYG